MLIGRQWFVALFTAIALSTVLRVAVAEPTSIALWLERPDNESVSVGAQFRIDVRATFDAPLVALEYDLIATGSAGLSVLSRTMWENDGAALQFLSSDPQRPFEGSIPQCLTENLIREVAFDAQFDATPGGVTDGLDPGEGVLLATLTLVAHCPGTATIHLSSADAATSFDAPDGRLFDMVDVDPANSSVTMTFSGAASPADVDCDGDVDLLDVVRYVDCLIGPNENISDESCNVFDTDGDSDVDLADAAALQRFFSGQQATANGAPHVSDPPLLGGGPKLYPDGDVDQDRIVDETDLVVIRQRLGEQFGDPGYDPLADVNSTDVIELTDIIFGRNRLGERSPEIQYVYSELSFLKMSSWRNSTLRVESWHVHGLPTMTSA